MSIDIIWLHWPGTYVRLTTIATAVVMALVILRRTRRPLLALVAVIGWLSAYEIAWEAGQVLYGRDPLRPTLWLAGAIIGWVIAAQLIGIRVYGPLLLLAAAVFALWLLAGYQQNWPGFPIQPEIEGLNVLSKTALAGAFLVGAMPAASAQPATSRVAATPGPLLARGQSQER